MFLFTTQPSQPATPQPTSGAGVSQPIAQAAQETGVSFDYLVKTAKRESGMNPEAKAPNSSATGLFQFIEQTWLGLVKRQGATLGLEEEANAISRDGSGRYVVSDSSTRQQILALRKDPTISSKMAGIFTAENRSTLRNALGREPNGGELYIAHFMGANGASSFISQAEANPDKAAASSFPEAASANRSIFFDGKGRARTLREVYARLISHHHGTDAEAAVAAAAAAPAVAQAQDTTRSPLAIGQARGGGNAFQGMFRSGGNAESAQALRKTWIGIAENRINRNAPSFFPRDGAQADAPREVAKVASLETPPGVLSTFEAQAPYEAVNLPTPPQRPATLGQQAAPLDLTRFGKNRR